MLFEKLRSDLFGIKEEGVNMEELVRYRSFDHFLESARVMIIDDQFVGRRVLGEIVRSISQRITIESFSDPEEALASFSGPLPDLILLDYKMPKMNGIDLIRAFREKPSGEDIPIIMVTILEDKNIRYQALDAGATDFLTRPLDQIECQCRCRNLLSLRKMTLEMQTHSRFLEREVAEATHLQRQRERETLLRLARAGEFHDFETGNHVVRMARYAKLIAQAMGLPEDHCETIELSAPMHDIGKIGIPDHILKKPGALTAEEYEVIKMHPMIGHQILKESSSRYIEMGSVIALAHQERYDGSGYPFGLLGKEIPLEARIVAVADVFDALTSVRPYKDAWPLDRAVAYLREYSGILFDPECVEAFFRQTDEIRRISIVMGDTEDPMK
jgi:two-component system response regulator RpfG